MPKPSLSQRGVFGEERAGRDRTSAERHKQSVGGGFVSRRKPLADGVDSATADRADAVTDADAGCKPGSDSDGWICRSEDDRDRFTASDEQERFGTDPWSNYRRTERCDKQRKRIYSCGQHRRTNKRSDRFGTDLIFRRCTSHFGRACPGFYGVRCRDRHPSFPFNGSLLARSTRCFGPLAFPPWTPCAPIRVHSSDREEGIPTA